MVQDFEKQAQKVPLLYYIVVTILGTQSLVGVGYCLSLLLLRCACIRYHVMAACPLFLCVMRCARVLCGTLSPAIDCRIAALCRSHLVAKKFSWSRPCIGRSFQDRHMEDCEELLVVRASGYLNFERYLQDIGSAAHGCRDRVRIFTDVRLICARTFTPGFLRSA